MPNPLVTTPRKQLKRVVKSTKSLVTSPRVQKTLATGKIHIFWANKVELLEDGKTTIHHGNRLAKQWQANHKDTSVVLANLEGKNGVPILDHVEKNTSLSEHEKLAICAGLSMSFAQGARDEIAACVFGANPLSFFRTNELPVLMANENITHVTLVSIENPDGTKYRKSEAYEVLRDEWLGSSIESYQKAATNKETSEEKYKDETRLLAKEIVLAEQRMKELKEQRMKELASNPSKNKDEIEREEARITRVVDLLQNDPNLQKAVKIEETIIGQSDKEQIAAILSKKPSWRKQVRKTFSNLKRSVTSFFLGGKEDKALDQSQVHKNTTAKPEVFTMVENPMITSRSTSSQDLQTKQSPATTPSSPGSETSTVKKLMSSIGRSERTQSLEDRPPSPPPTPNPPVKGNGSRTP